MMVFNSFATLDGLY